MLQRSRKALVVLTAFLGAPYSSDFILNLILEFRIGPVDLTTGTLSPGGNPVPTVVDNLFKAHSISSYTLGIFYEPATEPDTAISSGELSFGGPDSKIISSVAYVPITKTSPASEFWGIDQSVTYGTTKILSKTAGIVDTGGFLVVYSLERLR